MSAFVLVQDKCVECGKFFIGIDLPCGHHVCANDAEAHGAVLHQSREQR